MKTFVYGIVVGAFVAWIWATQGAIPGSTLQGMLGWREQARGSVSGYGGTRSGGR
ncbi:MAG: hypothetical protein ACKO2K_18095 [Alphaproteobacteria bacterium]